MARVGVANYTVLQGDHGSILINGYLLLHRLIFDFSKFKCDYVIARHCLLRLIVEKVASKLLTLRNFLRQRLNKLKLPL